MQQQDNELIHILHAKADLYAKVRKFFIQKQVLEVSTPIIRSYTVSDPYIDSISVENGFLQTSPEYYMKQLLALGSGSIYEITKCFRAKELSDKHNPEFTMLEWYRLGIDHFKLISEVAELVDLIIPNNAVKIISYRDLFFEFFQCNPHELNLPAAKNLLNKVAINITCMNDLFLTDCLDLLFTHKIQPNLTGNCWWFVEGFPECQKALAKLDANNIAQRFELFYNGMELANGYNELTDHQQQQQRFIADNKLRQQLNKPQISPDLELLNSLQQGLPSCSGVALGLDRLLMLQLNLNDISKII